MSLPTSPPGPPTAAPVPLSVGICLLSQGSAQLTGAWTYAREITRELGRRPEEVSVHLLCNEHGLRALQGWLPDTVGLACADGFHTGRTRAGRLAGMAAAYVRPEPLMRRFPAEIRLVHYPLTLNVPPAGVPRVMTLHDLQHHDLPDAFSRLQRAWRRYAYDGAARRASFVVTVSDHARERIISVLGIDPERVRTVRHGVDHKRFRLDPGPQESELLAALDLPDHFVYYPASLWPHKNHLRLLDAMVRVRDRELHLVLTGPTFGRLPELLAAASVRGLGDRVHHLGFVEDHTLPALYRAALALVFPSIYEGFGAPPLEAMACGCPVASSRAGSLDEVCGEAVMSLDPANVEQMAHSIEAIITDQHAQKRLRAAGVRQAARFTWSASVDALLGAYRQATDVALA